MALTKRQTEVLGIIHRLTMMRGPTIREIASELELAPCTVFKHVDVLSQQGLVGKDRPRQARDLWLTREGEKVLTETT